jgi:hypothetical protein
MYRKATTLKLAGFHATFVHQSVGFIGWRERQIDTRVAPRSVQRNQIGDDGQHTKCMPTAATSGTDQPMNKRVGDDD